MSLYNVKCDDCGHMFDTSIITDNICEYCRNARWHDEEMSHAEYEEKNE